MVEAPVDFILSEFEEWEEDRDTECDQGPVFEVPMAPDYLHKADVSGGAPYSLAVATPASMGGFSASRTRPRS